MANELQGTADVSARLDRLLSQYLQASRGELRPIACPPWRNHGRRRMEQDHASFTKADDARRVSPAYSAVENTCSQ